MERTDLIKTASSGLRAMADLLDNYSALSEKYDFKALLKEIPVVQTELFGKEKDPVLTAKTKKIEYVELRAVATEKVRSGYIHVLKVLFSKYGATKLSEVKKESYFGFLRDMNEYCRAISKEEIQVASERVLEARGQKYLTELFNFYSATCVDDLDPEHYTGFLWDSRRV